MSKKKTIFIRCSKVAPKRWKIEQRRKFLWIFEFWQKGAPSLGLDKEFYSNKQVAKKDSNRKAQKQGVGKVTVLNE